MTIRFGMIGAGQMAHIHAVAIAEQPGLATLVAVAGGTRAPALAAEFGAVAEPIVEALLERADIDAVVIATPHTAHLPNVTDAAAAGKHILLEKPMGLTVDECAAMIAACDAAGVRLSLAKVSRWLDAVRIGHDLVADGAAGEPIAIHVHRLFAGYPNTGWPLDPREGGAWLDWGSHGCDLVRWFAGREPTSVVARFASRRTDMPDLTGFATYEFPGALLANVVHVLRDPELRRLRAGALHDRRVRRGRRHQRVRRRRRPARRRHARRSIAMSATSGRGRPGTSTPPTSDGPSRPSWPTSSRRSATTDRRPSVARRAWPRSRWPRAPCGRGARTSSSGSRR